MLSIVHTVDFHVTIGDGKTIIVNMQKPNVCHLPPTCCQIIDNAARTYTARSSGQILVPLSLRIADDLHLYLAFIERGKYALITP